MDYQRPVESIIPGVRGRVLGVLTRTTSDLTMRTVAALAGVSVNQANRALHELIELGIVSRREAGAAAMVSLERDNEAARAILSLAGLQEAVTGRLGELAATLDPSPVSLVLFGSFVRGEASAASDLDVLVVIPDQPEDDWMTAFSGWVDEAARIAGNPVNFIVEHVGKIASLGKDVASGKRPGSLWEAIGAEGVVIHGASLATLGLAV